MTLTDIGVTFLLNHVLKHSKPGKHLADFHLRAFHNKHLCIVDCLKKYVKRRNTKLQTDNKAILITYVKPFTSAAIDSMRRWVKELFIETSILKNTRHTPVDQLLPANKSIFGNVDIAENLKQGCWKNAKTFLNFCKKDNVYYAPENVNFSVF